MNEIPYRYVDSVSFSIYTSEEIEKLSVVEITNPDTFDALGHPTPGGLHDRLLGPADRDDSCASCGLNSMQCPGHMGHIKLPYPVFNPVFLRTLFQLLQGCCFQCFKLVAPHRSKVLTLAQLKALNHGNVEIAHALTEVAQAFDADDCGYKGLEDALDQYIASALGNDNEIECASKKYFLSRNVMECRNGIIKEFLRDELAKGKKSCPHCGHSKQVLFLDGHSKIIAKSRGKKIVVPPKISAKKSSVEYDEFSGVIELDEPEELAEKKEIIPEEGADGATYILPNKAREILRQLWDAEKAILQELFGVLKSYQSYPVDIFFLELIPVPPTRFRPLSYFHGVSFGNPQTDTLNQVLLACTTIRKLQQCFDKNEFSLSQLPLSLRTLVPLITAKTPMQKLHALWIHLQLCVNSVYDMKMNKRNLNPIPGVKQILEKKEGLFRKHMMGKRVDYSARSVISPDPYIMCNEIGVPAVFATKLTYPQPVTPWNVQQLRQAVINGPKVHPGAVLVADERGFITYLRADNRVQREAIAKQLLTPSHSFHKGPLMPKVVYRHIQNGDVLLLNRQPTLHKPSIMAHKIRVLPREKTLRLHYANCKCYNADFDGDEMNAHCPQNELARSEAYNIASVNFQYLVPKDGTPLSGLIQDHLIGSTLLTLRGMFFSREDYQELVFGALTFVLKPIKILTPSIIKPVPLWTGKQVMSTILINVIPEGKIPLSMKSRAKIAVKNWQTCSPRPWKGGGTPLKEIDMSETEVIIREGELLCGVLDKGHFGPSPYGLVHLCYELYSGEVSTLLLTAVARLSTHFLQIYQGFTLGTEDIMVTPKANKKRKRVLKRASLIGNKSVAEGLGIDDCTDEAVLKQKFQDAHLCADDKYLKQIDNVMKSSIDSLNNEINDICMPNGLVKLFPYNNLQLMVKSGAKGSQVNCLQISCLLGQIELEGRRVPMMLSGKTLPSFSPYDMSPRAGGFVSGRFFSGIQPQEYFFHCMAGREGLVDTAVKTSRSGYLQRCMIKHLEGLVVNYDLTVRDSDGSVVQFLYGEDGLDILKSQMLKKDQFPILAENHAVLVSDQVLEEAKKRTFDESLHHYKKGLSKWKVNHHGQLKLPRSSAFTLFSASELAKNFCGQEGATSAALSEAWRNLNKKLKKQFQKQARLCPDPPTSKFRPDIVFGSLSDKLDDLIESYIKENPHKLLVDNEDVLDSKKYVFKMNKPIVRDKFQDLMYYLSMKSLCEPGEAVGLIAAQSIGEPSTQMTLNTFHFAGKGEMNVTLGIPRLREILMTASKYISTPSMELPLLPGPKIESHAEKLRLLFTRVLLKDVLEWVTVKETLQIKGSSRFRSYEIHFQFLPRKAYKRKYCITPSGILEHMEQTFFKRLATAMKRKLVVMSQAKILNMATAKVRAFRKAANNESKEGEEEGPSTSFVDFDKDEGDDSSGAEDEGGEGDSTSLKERQRRQQEQEYEEPEDEEKVDNVSDTEDIFVEDATQEGIAHASTIEDEDVKINEENMGGLSVRKQKKKLKQQELIKVKPQRVTTVLNMLTNDWISAYDFDTEKEEWCKVTFQLGLENGKLDMQSVIREECSKAVVHETPGITRAFLVKDPKSEGGSEKMLKTEGVSFHEVFKYDKYFDLNRLYSNDIHAIASTYGIEAAARALAREVTNVFAVYGIIVDPRHLLLISDYMTFSGTYKACSRHGLADCCSPIQQMTFETSLNFLKSATLSGYDDYLTSPSSRIVLGQVVQGGTGCFELKQRRSFIK